MHSHELELFCGREMHNMLNSWSFCSFLAMYPATFEFKVQQQGASLHTYIISIDLGRMAGSSEGKNDEDKRKKYESVNRPVSFSTDLDVNRRSGSNAGDDLYPVVEFKIAFLDLYANVDVSQWRD